MKKLAYQGQSEVFERIACDRRGRLFRVRFVIIERGGMLRGKIISCEEVRELRGFKNQDLEFKKFLPSKTPEKRMADISKRGGKPVLSPLSKFEFLTSIKIRAPSL